ncbi:MAG: hypothetical protein JJU12_07865 [Chlamydiales bacterium]|nr:hypothetical protein [Chlamydiales bacterium]
MFLDFNNIPFNSFFYQIKPFLREDNPQFERRTRVEDLSQAALAYTAFFDNTNFKDNVNFKIEKRTQCLDLIDLLGFDEESKKQEDDEFFILFHDSQPTKQSELGPLFQDNEKIYHSIGIDFYRLGSILKYGLLSKAAARSMQLNIPTTYGSGGVNGYNGENYISLSRAPFHKEAIGYECGAFGCYAKCGITFVISSDKKLVSANATGIAGECFMLDSIPTSDISAIMIENDLLDQSLSKINFLEGGGSGTVHLRAQSLYQYVVENTGFEDESLRAFIRNKAEKGSPKHVVISNSYCNRR